MFVCLGSNPTLHLRSYHDGAYLNSGTLTNINVLPHKNAMPQMPRYNIQTRVKPVVVLSIDVEHHTGIHSYIFKCLG